MSDLIFALASAKGRAGVSVIRLSGTNAIKSIEIEFDRAYLNFVELYTPWATVLRRVRVLPWWGKSVHCHKNADWSADPAGCQ